VYEYDFGDGWRHEVAFEGFRSADPKAKYPQCVGGERACPPEDCGGPWGFTDYLAAITDPKHERHGEMLEWRAVRSGCLRREEGDERDAEGVIPARSRPESITRRRAPARS